MKTQSTTRTTITIVVAAVMATVTISTVMITVGGHHPISRTRITGVDRVEVAAAMTDSSSNRTRVRITSLAEVTDSIVIMITTTKDSIPTIDHPSIYKRHTLILEASSVAHREEGKEVGITMVAVVATTITTILEVV